MPGLYSEHGKCCATSDGKKGKKRFQGQAFIPDDHIQLIAKNYHGANLNLEFEISDGEQSKSRKMSKTVKSKSSRKKCKRKIRSKRRRKRNTSKHCGCCRCGKRSTSCMATENRSCKTQRSECCPIKKCSKAPRQKDCCDQKKCCRPPPKICCTSSPKVCRENPIFSNCCEKQDDCCCKKQEVPCCKKQEDPCCKKQEDPCCKKQEDPCCKKQEDPCCTKQEDPCCKKQEDPCCTKQEDPCCKNQVDFKCCKTQIDPCGKAPTKCCTKPKCEPHTCCGKADCASEKPLKPCPCCNSMVPECEPHICCGSVTSTHSLNSGKKKTKPKSPEEFENDLTTSSDIVHSRNPSPKRGKERPNVQKVDSKTKRDKKNKVDKVNSDSWTEKKVYVAKRVSELENNDVYGKYWYHRPPLENVVTQCEEDYYEYMPPRYQMHPAENQQPRAERIRAVKEPKRKSAAYCVACKELMCLNCKNFICNCDCNKPNFVICSLCRHKMTPKKKKICPPTRRQRCDNTEGTGGDEAMFLLPLLASMQGNTNCQSCNR